MYIFCVTDNISKAGHGLSSSESTYKRLGQAKTLQNNVNTNGRRVLHFIFFPSNFTRLYYNGSAAKSHATQYYNCSDAKSHSTTTQYRQLRRLQFNQKTVKFRVISRRGGFQFLLYKFIRIQTARSNMRNFSALNSLLSDLWEKRQKFGRFKNLKLT